MSATLTGEDRNIHGQMLAVSPATDIDAGVWKLGDNHALGDDVASTLLAVGPGFTGSLDMTLQRADTSVGDSNVKLFRRYRDRDGNVLSEVLSPALSITATAGTTTLALSAAPAGTAELEVGLLSNMTPPGDPTRTNEFLDPRCSSTTAWSARNSWTLTAQTSGAGLPAGVTTYVRSTCPTAGAATNSGLDMFTAVGASNPAATGQPAIPGATMTFSVYVYSTKGGTFVVQVRPFSGTTWSAASTDTTVSLTAATWTRVTVTLTIPAGATMIAATLRMSSSITWAVGDYIGVSCILLEQAGAVAPYFDGTSQDASISAPKSSRWESAANASRSLLYAATVPGGTTVQAVASSLSYAATADELIGAALERQLRRSVADVWNAEQSLITAGTPGLLSGQLTFLCASLAQALAVDSVYRMAGLITLTTADELNGLQHRAVGTARMNPERVLPGRPARWLLVVDFREQSL